MLAGAVTCPAPLCRLAVFQALHGQAPDIDVRCSNQGLGGTHEPFQAMMRKMEHSQFCLALPGDSPSTRRLSEIFMAGASFQTHAHSTLGVASSHHAAAPETCCLGKHAALWAWV